MEKEGLKKPLILVMEETKDSIAQIMRMSQLPGYVLETILGQLYNECLMIKQKELEKAKQEYSDAIKKNLTNNE